MFLGPEKTEGTPPAQLSRRQEACMCCQLLSAGSHVVPIA